MRAQPSTLARPCRMTRRLFLCSAWGLGYEITIPGVWCFAWIWHPLSLASTLHGRSGLELGETRARRVLWPEPAGDREKAARGLAVVLVFSYDGDSESGWPHGTDWTGRGCPSSCGLGRTGRGFVRTERGRGTSQCEGSRCARPREGIVCCMCVYI